MQMKQLSAVIRKEGAWYVAQCLDVDVSSFGATKAQARANLVEALGLYFNAGPSAISVRVYSSRANALAGLGAEVWEKLGGDDAYIAAERASWGWPLKKQEHGRRKLSKTV